MVKVLQDEDGGEHLFQFAKGGIALGRPNKGGNVLPEQLEQGRAQDKILEDKPMVEVGESQEAFDIFDIARGDPIQHHVHLLEILLYAVYGDNESEERCPSHDELALRGLDEESGVEELSEHLAYLVLLVVQ